VRTDGRTKDARLRIVAERVRGHISARSFRNVSRLLVVALTAATLAACAQAPTTTGRSAFSNGHQALLRMPRHVHPAAVAASTRLPRDPSVGVASFYTEGTRTANGEKFDTTALTAAHPTLPFGTRLRVTSVDTGRSVIVRVNDRGPFIKGRAVDVSYNAAERLGMTEKGVAKVKLEVVQ
jgi:rare lipoprotein A